MKLRSAWIKNICLIMFGLVLLTSGLQAAEASPVVIVPMQLQQGSLVSVRIPQFDGGMPGEAMAMFNERYRQVVLQRLREFEPIAYETRLMPQLPAAVKNALMFMAEYEVFRSDATIVSLTQKVYQFSGGAHGMTWQTGHTIDIVNAKQLLLPELFAAGSDYAERLNRFVREQGAARNLPMWEFKGVGVKSAFYLNEDGVVLFFQPYEVAPYSEGVVHMLIPYRLLADILRPEILR